jgi:cyclomaltodextrinase / maltogenic alpha-amylase / neopullulanase
MWKTSWKFGVLAIALTRLSSISDVLLAQQCLTSTPWPSDGALYEVGMEYFPHHSFDELAAQMPRLASLGVNTIYILPIWENLGKQIYLIKDYYKIDPRYGSAEDLKNLIRTAHSNKIRVLLDMVTSITYDGTWIFDHHPEWILIGIDGQRQRYHPFPQFGWGLDCAKPEVIAYFAGVVKYYQKEFDLDGWRIDSPLDNYDPKKVAGDHGRLPLLRALKSALMNGGRQPLFVCEVSSPGILSDPENTQPVFDHVCESSYHMEFSGLAGGNPKSGFHYVLISSPGKFRTTMLDKILNRHATSKDFARFIDSSPRLCGSVRSNFIENHDTERISWAFPKQHRALFALTVTMPGTPVIHAGQELGTTVPAMAGERKGQSQVVDWEKGDIELEQFYRTLTSIRREHPAVASGEFHDIWSGGDQSLAFVRNQRKDVVAAVFNFGASTARSVLTLPLAELGLQAERNYRVRNLMDGTESVQRGELLKNWTLTLPPYGYAVFGVDEGR